MKLWKQQTDWKWDTKNYWHREKYNGPGPWKWVRTCTQPVSYSLLEKLFHWRPLQMFYESLLMSFIASAAQIKSNFPPHYALWWQISQNLAEKHSGYPHGVKIQQLLCLTGWISLSRIWNSPDTVSFLQSCYDYEMSKLCRLYGQGYSSCKSKCASSSLLKNVPQQPNRGKWFSCYFKFGENSMHYSVKEVRHMRKTSKELHSWVQTSVWVVAFIYKIINVLRLPDQMSPHMRELAATVRTDYIEV